MFTSLIESLREAVDEARLMPFSLSAQKIRDANERLKKLRRDAGHSEKPDVNTKRKVLFRLGSGTGTGTDNG
jgi:hypothetical protein